jgi:CPA1 family monovalent cation:H+ antiporter
MKLFDILAVLVTLSAAFSYLNYRYVRLPTTIGLMLIALVMSLGLIALDFLGLGIKQGAEELLGSVDFDETLLHGMLSFLLFAGALHVNLVSWWTFNAIGLVVPLIYCLLFGALISPTDPVAVLSILKSSRVPKSLETKITGEVIVLLGVATGGHEVTPAGVVFLFAKEALGGVAFGLAIGALSYWMLKRVDNYQVEILITLALVTGGYAFADALHISGPISIVVAGLLIGNHGPWAPACYVGEDATELGHVLGTRGPDSERGSICVDRPGSTGTCIHPGVLCCRSHSYPHHAVGSIRECGASCSSSASLSVV